MGAGDTTPELNARLNLDLSALQDGVREAAKQGGAIGGALGGAIGAALGGVLEGVAGKVSGLFGEALGREASSDKLAAQLGLSPADQAKAGKIAGDAFANNYGDSYEQLNESVRDVVSNIGLSLDDVDFAGINNQVLSLSSTFEQDLGGTTSAVGQLLKTGLAKDAQQALDIITVGFQQGADKSGDFLDTLNEYGTQFRKLGISGEQATGLISQGLKAGARDGDIVADALKEFSIRAIDGSDATVEAYHQLGLGAQDYTKKIAAGGPAANEALSVVLDRLRAIKDPADQAATATALFGGQAEDLGAALFALDPTSAVKALGGVAGAAEDLDAQIAGNSKATLGAFTRQLQGEVVGALESGVIPALTGAASGLSTTLGPALQRVGPIISSVVSGVADVSAKFREVTSTIPTPVLQGLGIVLGVVAAALAVQAIATAAATAANTAAAAVTALFTTAVNLETGATERGIVARTGHNIAVIAGRAASIAAAAATAVLSGAQAALNAVMALSPIGLVVLALVALTAAFVVAYKKSETFRDIIKGAFGVVTGVVDSLRGAVGGTVDFVRGKFDDMVNFVTGLPGRISDGVRGMFDGMKEAFKSAINFIIRGLNNFEIKIPGFDPPGPGPKFDGFTVGLPNIPELAAGGVVTTKAGGAGTPFIAGEGNYDELVQPLRPLEDTFGTEQIVSAIQTLIVEVRKQNDRALQLARQGAI